MAAGGISLENFRALVLVPGGHFSPCSGEWCVRCSYLDSMINGLSSLTVGILPYGFIFPVRVDLGYSLVWFDF